MNWLDRLTMVFLFVVATALPSSPASAHSSSTFHPAGFGNNTVAWRFTPSVPAGYRAAIQAGADSWDPIGTGFRFGTATNNGGDFDPHDLTYCINFNNFNSAHYAGGTGGAADAVWCRTGSSMDKFGVTFDTATTWYTGTGTPTATDLWSSAAHEFGHANGFVGSTGHFNDPNPDPVVCAADLTRATMCTGGQSNIWRRTPEPHDIHTFAGSYTTNQYCGFVVYGGFRDKYVLNGTNTGAFGCPTIEEYDVNDGGRREDFANGNMTFHPSIGVFSVKNAIASRWRALGGTAWGFPMIDETLLPDGQGYHNHFRLLSAGTSCGQNNDRSIYWHSSTGAHGVQGLIRERWCALGWEGNVGYPATDENTTPDGVGRYNHFLKIGQAATCSTNGNQSIYWRPETGAHQVKGGIRQRWCALGWEGGIVGYPTTDETPTPVRTGAYNHFKKYSAAGTFQYDASIYWSPTYGAWEVYGSVRSKWSTLGWEGGSLGFPKGARANVSTGFQQPFEYGAAYASTSTGTVRALWGPVYNRYVTEGGPSSTLGFPVTDVYTPALGGTGDKQADFTTGSIRYVAATNTTIVCPVRC